MTVAAALVTLPMSELLPGWHCLLPGGVECVIVNFIEWTPDGVRTLVANPDDLSQRFEFFAPYGLIVEAHRGDDGR